MITFTDWELAADGDVIARQYDNLSRTLCITGDIPAGWGWDLLVSAQGNLDIIALSPTDGGIGVTLTAGMLALSGYYTLQLRGTRQDGGIPGSGDGTGGISTVSDDKSGETVPASGDVTDDGVTVRHTNQIQVYIPASLSGDAQWPEVPSEFTQMEQRLQDLNRHPPTPGADGMWMLWDPDTGQYEPSDIPLPEGGGYAIGAGLKIVDGYLTVDTADAVAEDDPRPVASAAVYVELGNVEALLGNI